MRTQLLTISLLCAGSLLAQGQNSSSGTSRVNRPDDPLNSSSSKSTDSSSSSSSPGSSYGSSSSHGSSSQFGATGRMGQHEIRASKLNGSTIKTSTGEELGKIDDVIINPASGRIDFAVISYSGSSGSGSASSTSGTNSSSSASSQSTPGAAPGSTASSQSTPGSTIGSTTTTTTSGEEKLVAVPWQLIRPSGMLGYGTSAATPSSTEQMSFVFTGEKTKLDGAPSFSQSNWPDLTQPSWRQSVFSYFGVQPGSATGGSFSPGGSSRGSSSQESPSSSSPSSSSTSPSPDSSKPPGSPDNP